MAKWQGDIVAGDSGTEALFGYSGHIPLDSTSDVIQSSYCAYSHL